MRKVHACRLIGILVCGAILPVANRSEAADQTVTSTADILGGLEENRDKSLQNFIDAIPAIISDMEEVSEKEIQAIVEKLSVIELRDRYQAKAFTKGGRDGDYYPNRVAAESCIRLLRREIHIRQIRKLPLEERVITLMSELNKGRSWSFNSWNSHGEQNLLNAYEKELVATGVAGVPLIIEQSQALPRTTLSVVNVLRYISDSQSEDYLIDALRYESIDKLYVRSDAAFALGVMKGPHVLAALTDALLDEEYMELDRDPPQIAHTDSEWQIARFYAVRYAASESLSKLTGKHWGSLYNEEHAIWKAWLDSSDKEGFDPDLVGLAVEDLKMLIEMLFHRRMSGRPNPWQPHNELEKPLEMDIIAKSLESRGGKVIGILVEECRERIVESPKFDADLRVWTRELLQRMSWESAKLAAKELE